MSDPAPLTGASRPVPETCPGAGVLEHEVESGAVSINLRTHIDACPDCREREQAVRENLQFMNGFLSGLGAADAAPPALDPVSPDILPGYRLLREIARGGQGTVYEALQLETKRRVAVKMIDPRRIDPTSGSAAARADRGRKRIEREAEISAGLRHPNIVTVYSGSALPDGRYALAMELVEGVAIDRWARQIDASTATDRASAREGVRAKLRAMVAVCDAVQFAHHNGVIHRDLKPANILIGEAGIPRVVDFGIARRTTLDATITREGEFAGTLAYASPEQVSGDPDSIDSRSDVYSLGVILFELLAARRPYETEHSLTGAIANITRTEPEPLDRIEPGHQPAGDELQTIVRRALAKDRADRYQTAGALKADIENFLAGRAVDAKRDSALYILRKTAARHRVAVGVAAGFILLLAAVAVHMAWSARRLDRQAGLLAASLSSSTIERGRLLAVNGSHVRAEDLIWPELIRTGADPSNPRIAFESGPETLQAVWALIDLYSRYPSLLNQPVAGRPLGVAINPTGDTVHLMRKPSNRPVQAVSGLPLTVADHPFDFGIDRLVIASTRTHLIARSGPTVRIFDTLNSTETQLTDPKFDELLSIDVSPATNRLITIGNDGSLRLWSLNPFQQITVIRDGYDLNARAWFSDDGRFITGPGDAALHRWHAQDGAEAGTWRIGPDFWKSAVRPTVYSVRQSPDGRRLVAAMNNWLLVYDIANKNTPIKQVSAHTGFVNYTCFSADGKRLLTTGHERTIRIWDADTIELLAAFEQGYIYRSPPALSSAGEHLALCDDSDAIRIWQTQPRQWFTQLGGSANTVSAVRFSPDHRFIAATSADGQVRVWNTADRRLVWSSSTPSGAALTSLAFSPDGATLAVAAQDGLVTARSATTGEGFRELFRGGTFATWIGYSPDGSTIGMSAGEGGLLLVDAATGGRHSRVEFTTHTRRVVEAAFSPDGASIASASADNTCFVWDRATGAIRHRLAGHRAAVRAVCYSPDGGRIATGSDDWTIRIWDARTGACLHTLKDVKQHVFGLAFHPSGHILFSCCRDPVIQVWDPRTERELALLEGHTGTVFSLAIAGDGQTLASASSDGTVGVWDLTYYLTHVRGNAPAWLHRARSK